MSWSLGGRSGVDWLNTFKSLEFLRQSGANITNRDKKKLHHSTGSKPFIYGALELKKNGESMPLLNNYELSYSANHPEANSNFDKIRAVVNDKTEKVRNVNPGMEDDQIVHYFDELTQVQVLIEALGQKNKKVVTGVGRANFVSLPSHHSIPPHVGQ